MQPFSFSTTSTINEGIGNKEDGNGRSKFKSVTATAFDPKSPSTLIYFSSSPPSDQSSTDNGGAGGGVGLNVNVFSADNGIGCNAEESSALMHLLNSRDEYLNGDGDDDGDGDDNNENDNGNRGKRKDSSNSIRMNIKSLSRAYRKHLYECIQGWEMRLINQQHQQEHQHQHQHQQQPQDLDGMKEEEDNLDLLKISSTIAHLCEIFLLENSDTLKQQQSSASASASISLSQNNNNYMMNGMGMSMLPGAGAGIVTADTVRYLRKHHMMDPSEYVAFLLEEGMEMGMDTDMQQVVDLDELLEMNQPEYYDPSTSASASTGIGDINISTVSSGMTPYWSLVRKLVLWGSLEEAWAVLSRHSACKRSQMLIASGEPSHVDRTVEEDAAAFELIRSLLLSAPIPGGINRDNDDGLANVRDDADDNNYRNDNNSDDDDEELLPGLPRDGYKNWDVDAEDPNVFDFNVHAILNLHTTWKTTIDDIIKTHASVRNLIRRIPMLNTCIFDVILKTKKCYMSEVDGGKNSDTWAERLSSELLYVRPQTVKEDMHIRATDHMKAVRRYVSADEDEDVSAVEEITVLIMKGNAGAVIGGLNSYGGGSSAALPATMTALQCNLLVDSGTIELTELSYDIESELMLSASSAILSSFAIQGHNKVGVRLAMRLLQPHIIPENHRVTACIADVLARHWPQTDAEVVSLLSSCKDSVSRGSRRMLDACDSLCFSRSLHYDRKGNGNGDYVYAGKSVHFLLRAIEQSSFFGSEMMNEDGSTNDLFPVAFSAFTSTICFRRLTSLCANTVQFVLDQISQCFEQEDLDITALAEPLKIARSIMDTVAEDEVYHLVSTDPCVSLLQHVMDVGINLATTNNVESARSIIECLKDRKSTDGSIIILAHPGLYGNLLTIAFDILEAEAKADLTPKISAFDLEAMQILMIRFTQYCSRDELYINQVSSSNMRKVVTPSKMRFMLGKGLMRAFVMQNAMLDKDGDKDWCNEHNRSGVDEITEQSVECLLEPCL